jgi:hypothetical protein
MMKKLVPKFNKRCSSPRGQISLLSSGQDIFPSINFTDTGIAVLCPPETARSLLETIRGANTLTITSDNRIKNARMLFSLNDMS